MGKAHHLLKISIAMAVIESFSEENYVNDRINLLLSILPRGTKFTGIESAMQGELLKKVVLAFEHPALVDDDEIKLKFKDVLWQGEPGKIEWQIVLTGVEYAVKQ